MGRMESPTDRTTTVSAPLKGDRLERLEDYVDDRDVSKAEAIRRGIDAITDGVDLEDGRVPPDDDDLATAWRALRRLTDGGGWVRQDRATSYLAQRVPDYDKGTVYGGLLRPLSQRGYIQTTADAQGQSAAVYVHE